VQNKYPDGFRTLCVQMTRQNIYLGIHKLPKTKVDTLLKDPESWLSIEKKIPELLLGLANKTIFFCLYD
jgi:hypothetical protein